MRIFQTVSKLLILVSIISWESFSQEISSFNFIEEQIKTEKINHFNFVFRRSVEDFYFFISNKTVHEVYFKNHEDVSVEIIEKVAQFKTEVGKEKFLSLVTDYLDEGRKKLLLQKNFFTYPYVQTINKFFAPYCAKIVFEEQNGFVEYNPCYAGGRLAVRQIYKKDWKALLKKTMNALILVANRQESVDFEQELKNSGVTLSLGFNVMFQLSTVTSFSTGHWDDVSFNYFILDTLDELAAVDIYENQVFIKETKKDYLKLQKLMKGKSYLIGDNINAKNWMRHEWASSFLSCYFSDRYWINGALISSSLGFLYESFDFVSHLKSGSSLKESTAAFKKDFNRYRANSNKISELCSEEL